MVSARRTDAAMAPADDIEVYPDYLPAIQGLARYTMRAGLADERLDGWLREIALRSTDATWRDWAVREQRR